MEFAFIILLMAGFCFKVSYQDAKGTKLDVNIEI